MMHGKPIAWAAALLLLAGAPAQAEKTIAHSKSLEMSFTARGEPWCKPHIDMRVAAQDAAGFEGAEYREIVQKLGHVLAKECPEATRVTITGAVGEQVVWQGSALRDEGWLARAKPPVAGSAPLGAGEGAPAQAAAGAEPAVAPPAPAGEPGIVPAPQAAPAGTAAVQAAGEPSVAARTGPKPLEVAGWRPGVPGLVARDAGNMVEIAARKNGCRVRTFVEIRPELQPDVAFDGDFACEGGYVRSEADGRSDLARLFYAGQSQPFAQLGGLWIDGYNLDRGHPLQIVSRYKGTTRDRWNRGQPAEKLLAWVGEDRELRAHFFATYTYRSSRHDWALDVQAPLMVLSDQPALVEDPVRSGLARSLAEVNRRFRGYRSLDSFSEVSFVLVNELHDAAGRPELATSMAELAPSVLWEGRAVRRRGMPWALEITLDFASQRAAQAEAERRRAEAHQERLVALRASHQASLEAQYQKLLEAGPYDRVRFVATLALARERIEPARIDFTSSRLQQADPLTHAVAFTHPAQFASQAQAGEVALQEPMHLLVEAQGDRIAKPYPMLVEDNESGEALRGWMLVQLAPRFGFGFDEAGEPVFRVQVQAALACRSERCLDEMDPASMMKAWYEDEELELAAAAVGR